ncbi:MAG: GNAT family N-acetyltransferase [Gammaproteobacteria bacterium]|nr:GNAT family N-acetyltransferase [Gammaproteobacteria bacterium]
MIYRNMKLSDHEAVMALWGTCNGLSLRDADSRQSTGKYLQRNPGLSFVAQDKTGIVGTLMAGHDGRRGYIQHLAVTPELRGKGVGDKLVELCLDALKLEGIVKSHVHVLADNSSGRAFWLNRGWIHRAEIEMYSFVNSANQNA